MKKIKQFITDLRRVLKSRKTKYIKMKLGDSIRNNRVLTVNQLLRFLTRKEASKNQRELGRKLQLIYYPTKSMIKSNRRLRKCERTDAFDINEFIKTFNQVATKNNDLTKYINNLLRG